jgi:hypothetical protein
MSSVPLTILVESEGGGPVSLTPEVLQAIVQTCSANQINNNNMRIVIQNHSSDDAAHPVLELSPDLSHLDVAIEGADSQVNMQQNSTMLHGMSVRMKPIQHEETIHDSPGTIASIGDEVLSSDPEEEPIQIDPIKVKGQTSGTRTAPEINNLEFLTVQASTLSRVVRTKPACVKSLDEIITAAKADKVKKMNKSDTKSSLEMSGKYIDENTCNKDKYTVKLDAESNLKGYATRSRCKHDIEKIGDVQRHDKKDCIELEGIDSDVDTGNDIILTSNMDCDDSVTRCGKCDKVFPGLQSITLLRIHRRYCKAKENISEDTDSESKLEDSESKLVDSSSVESHSENGQHNGDKLTCKTCGKKFDRKFNLERHLQSKNVHQVGLRKKYVPKPAKCDICEKMFHSSSALSVHRKIHDEDQRYLCSVCDRRFTQMSNMKQHMKTIHYHIKDEACDICGKQFSHITGLLYHKHKVHVEEQMIQRYADLEYVKRYQVDQKTSELAEIVSPSEQVHVIGEHKYKCLVCPKGFEKVFSWFVHLNLHLTTSDLTEYLEQKIYDVLKELKGRNNMFDSLTLYPCDACDYVCVNKSDMQLHMNRHSEDRPYPCQYCHVKFASRTECTSHEQYHTKQFKHRCSLCDAGFPFQKQLDMHLVKVHNILEDSRSGVKVVHRCETCDLVFPYKVSQ